MTRTNATKKTRNSRTLGAGEACDKIEKIRAEFQQEADAAFAALIAKRKERLAEREQKILARCVDPDRARQILALETER